MNKFINSSKFGDELLFISNLVWDGARAALPGGFHDGQSRAARGGVLLRRLRAVRAVGARVDLGGPLPGREFAAGWLAGWQSECMDSYDSEPSHILQHFSSSTRKTDFCTAYISKFSDLYSAHFGDFCRIFSNCCWKSAEIADFCSEIVTDFFRNK